MARAPRKASAAAYTAIARQVEQSDSDDDALAGSASLLGRSRRDGAVTRRTNGRVTNELATAKATAELDRDRGTIRALLGPVEEELYVQPAIKAGTASDSDASELSAVPSSDDLEAAAPPPKKRRAPRTKKAPADTAADEDAEAIEGEAKPKRRRKAKAKTDKDGDEDDAKEPKKKRTRKPKVTEPIVYDIPDVVQRDFKAEGGPERAAERAQRYRGRLGYACLNTVLRACKPSVFSSRTTRIKSIEEKGLDFVRELALANVRDIIPMIEWNEAHGIKFMRLSSEMFPFATHPIYGYDFVSFAKDELAAAGEVARKYGHRLTMHPGQFCQLGTPKADVLEASIRELEMHAQILDSLGMGPDSVMILHGGGVYGDREATIERIKNTIKTRLSPSARARLVLENDELAYSVEELLPISQELKVPLVLDFHHDMLRPSSRPPSELIPDILEVWKERGIRPKFHLSEPRPGAKTMRERRAHSDRCIYIPSELPADADLMIEAKDKEQAVFDLFRIYDLVDVKPFWDDLRPPASDQSTSVAGRKRSAGKNTSATSNSDAAKALRTLIKAKKVERRMQRERAWAAGRTPPPEGDSDLDDWSPAKDRPPVATQEEVLQDMREQADWIRGELRAGRGRGTYGEQGSEGEDEAALLNEDGEVVDTTASEAGPLTSRGKKAPGKAPTTQPQVDGQAAGAQEDLVAVVSAGSGSAAKPEEVEEEALVVKPGVAAEPSAEATPLTAAANGTVGRAKGGKGASKRKG